MKKPPGQKATGHGQRARPGNAALPLGRFLPGNAQEPPQAQAHDDEGQADVYKRQLCDAPEHFAKALDMQTDDWLEFLSEIEARGLVAQNTDASYVGQDSYGYSRQLAEVGARQASFADGWGYANSQETEMCIRDRH